mgnify:FL=1
MRSASWKNGPKPEARHQFSMYLTGKWRRLTAKEGTFAADDVIGSLDVSILQDNLLAPILGIKTRVRMSASILWAVSVGWMLWRLK